MFYILQSNEVGNSLRMDKEGLVRELSVLASAGVSVCLVVTDTALSKSTWERRGREKSSKSGDEMVAKWTSVANHIQEISEHDNPCFPKREHEHLIGQEARQWLWPSKWNTYFKKYFFLGLCPAGKNK